MTATNAPAILFREDRRVRSGMLWLIVLVLSSLTLGTMAWMVMHGTRTLWMALPAALWLGGIALLALITFQVEVSDRGLFLRMWPLHRRVHKIDLDRVKEVRAIRFRPVFDYGGYGIRFKRQGKAYILEGNEGVRVDYDNGYHLLIETRHPRELAHAIELYIAHAAPDGGASEAGAEGSE